MYFGIHDFWGTPVHNAVLLKDFFLLCPYSETLPTVTSLALETLGAFFQDVIDAIFPGFGELDRVIEQPVLLTHQVEFFIFGYLGVEEPLEAVDVIFPGRRVFV